MSSNVDHPRFTLGGYADLLSRLKALGYSLHGTADITRIDGRACFLRHDVDLHLEGALDLAAVEEFLGVRSTWYIGTRLAYNPGFEPNAAVIRELVKCGHTIGLHYLGDQVGLTPDLETLEAIGAKNVETWVMHEPSAGGADHHMCKVSPYATGNPHAYGLHYVSDSRMQWTEPYVSQLLAGEPERVMLNTHHEHWLGSVPRPERAFQIRAKALSANGSYVDRLLKGYWKGYSDTSS